MKLAIAALVRGNSSVGVFFPTSPGRPKCCEHDGYERAKTENSALRCHVQEDVVCGGMRGQPWVEARRIAGMDAGERAEADPHERVISEYREGRVCHRQTYPVAVGRKAGDAFHPCTQGDPRPRNKKGNQHRCRDKGERPPGALPPDKDKVTGQSCRVVSKVLCKIPPE